MKRLVAQIGITYFSVLAAAFYLSLTVVKIIGSISFLAVIICFAVRKLRESIYIPAIAVAALLACIVHIGYTYLAVIPLEMRFSGGEHEVQAVVTEEPYRSYGKNYYQLRTVIVDGEAFECRLMLKLPYAAGANVDDVLTFRSGIERMDNDYYRSKGYYIVSDSYDTVVNVQPSAEHSLYYRVVQARGCMRSALCTYLPEDCADLCRAVLIGDKYAPDISVRDNFRYAGASYYIVVSGMHFSVLYLLIRCVVKHLHFRRIRLIVYLIFVLAYMTITGFQAAVMRSGIMIIVMIFGDCLRRQPYPLNHLGVAGLLLPCIFSPYGAGNIGMLLSFYATLAVLLWATPIANQLCYIDESGNMPQLEPGKWIHRKIEASGRKKKVNRKPDFRMLRHKLRNAFCSLLSVSLAANILVFPISVFVFREFSAVTLISSTLLYLPIYLILFLALLLCVLFFIKPIAVALSAILLVTCRYVLLLVDFLGNLPFAHFKIGHLWFFIWMGMTVILGALVMMSRKPSRYLKPAVLICVILLMIGWTTHTLIKSCKLELEVYACKEGMCVGINSGGTLHLLRLDAKTNDLYEIMGELSYRYGGAETALCLSRADMEKYQLYSEDEFAISSYLLYDKDKTVYDGVKTIRFEDNSTFRLDEDLTLRVVAVSDAVIPFVTAGDQRILLLPKVRSVMELPEELRHADIIIASGELEGIDGLEYETLILSGAGSPDDSDKKIYVTGESDLVIPLR